MRRSSPSQRSSAAPSFTKPKSTASLLRSSPSLKELKLGTARSKPNTTAKSRVANAGRTNRATSLKTMHMISNRWSMRDLAAALGGLTPRPPMRQKTQLSNLNHNILSPFLSLRDKTALAGTDSKMRRNMRDNVATVKAVMNKHQSYLNSMAGPKSTFGKTRKHILMLNPGRLHRFSNVAPDYDFSKLPYERWINIRDLLNARQGAGWHTLLTIAHGFKDGVTQLNISGNEEVIAQACIDGALGNVKHLSYVPKTWEEGTNRPPSNPAPIIIALQMGALPKLDYLTTDDAGIARAFLEREKSRVLHGIGLPGAIMRECTNLEALKIVHTPVKDVIDNIDTSVKYALKRLTVPIIGLRKAERQNLSRKIVKCMPKLEKLVLSGRWDLHNPFDMDNLKNITLPPTVKLEVKRHFGVHYLWDPP